MLRFILSSLQKDFSTVDICWRRKVLALAVWCTCNCLMLHTEGSAVSVMCDCVCVSVQVCVHMRLCSCVGYSIFSSYYNCVAPQLPWNVTYKNLFVIVLFIIKNCFLELFVLWWSLWCLLLVAKKDSQYKQTWENIFWFMQYFSVFFYKPKTIGFFSSSCLLKS